MQPGNPDQNEQPTSENPAVEPFQSGSTPEPAVPQTVSSSDINGGPATPASTASDSTRPTDPSPADPTSLPPVSPATPTVPSGPSAGSKLKFRWSKRKLAAAIVLLVIILGGGYVFAFYLPNTPSNVYKTGLQRTGEGYDRLVSYLSTEQSKHYKGFDANGTFKLTSPDGSGDGTFTEQSDGANSTGQAKLDLSGEKFSANFRSVEPKGQDEPDIYLQVNGVKQIFDSFGLNDLDNLDGQWIAIDHTLLDTAVASQTGGKSSQKASAPSYAQVQDALQKISPVNKKYLFTTDKKYAVLVKQKFLGKSTQDGRTVDGYQVGYDKANLKAYVNALGTALDGSSLNAWVKQTTGKTITDEINLSDLQKSIGKSKGDYTFDLYIDTQTKLIHKVHFTDPKNPANNFVEAALDYTGGSKYPLVLSGTEKDGSTTDNFKITITLDTSNNQVNFDASYTEKGDTTSTFNMSFTAKPSNQSVQVTAPANAEPVMNVIQNLGLGGLLSGDTGLAPADVTTSTDPFTLTE